MFVISFHETKTDKGHFEKSDETYSLESVMLVRGAICWIEGGGDEARDPCLDDILLDDNMLGLFMSLIIWL